jgi:hypothetical protein
MQSQTRDFDAIVVGSGISGGWAAKELTEKGLRVLLLERGKNVEHLTDYVNARKGPWEYPHRGGRTREMEEAYPVLKRDYPLNEKNLDWWASDQDSPYTEIQRFDWYRGYHVGGRSLTWGRQSYRLSEYDFEANAREGIAIDWPISFSTVDDYIGQDAIRCHEMCPGTEVILFSYRNPGEEPEDMISLSGMPYRSTPYAFRFRQEVSPDCACQRREVLGSVTLADADDGQSRAVIAFGDLTFPLPQRDPRRVPPSGSAGTSTSPRDSPFARGSSSARHQLVAKFRKDIRLDYVLEPFKTG